MQTSLGTRAGPRPEDFCTSAGPLWGYRLSVGWATMHGMRPRRLTIAFDTADLDAESGFWAALLDGEVVREDHDWHTVTVPGMPDIGVQLSPDHVPSRWPDEGVQVHLDLDVDDIRAAEAEALAKGARLVQEPYPLDADEGFRVYASPAGHPFCLCWGA